MKKIKHAIEYAAMTALLLPLRILPFRWSVAIGGAAGGLLWRLGIRRSVSRFNLHLCLPEFEGKAADRVLCESYRNFCRSMVEFALLPRLRGRTGDFVEIKDLESLRAMVAKGVGALMVTGHFGSWELLGAALCEAGVPLDFLVGEQSNAAVDNFINNIRASMGAGIIHMGVAARGVIKAVRSGRMVAMLSDQDAGKSSVVVNFFGHPASTPQGVAAFGFRLKCPIVFGSIYRVGKTTHHVIESEIVFDDYEGLPEKKEDAIRQITQIYTDRLEEAVRRAPQMYFWAHRRFKHTMKYS